MKEIYKRRYADDNVVEEDILLSSNNEDKINVFLNDYAKKNGYFKSGNIWININDNNQIIVVGNGDGLI